MIFKSSNFNDFFLELFRLGVLEGGNNAFNAGLLMVGDIPSSNLELRDFLG